MRRYEWLDLESIKGEERTVTKCNSVSCAAFIARASLELFLLLHTAVALTSQFTKQQLVAELQRRVTPADVLDRDGRHVKPRVDADGNLSALILVRLSKQMISIGYTKSSVVRSYHLADDILFAVTCCLASSDASNVDALVGGTKACSVISRLDALSNGNNDQIYAN
jgi:hypothetical protein